MSCFTSPTFLAASMDDLDRAITVKEQALALILPKSPLRITILQNLAGSLYRRSELAGSLDHFARASNLLEETVLSTTFELWKEKNVSIIFRGSHCSHRLRQGLSSSATRQHTKHYRRWRLVDVQSQASTLKPDRTFLL